MRFFPCVLWACLLVACDPPGNARSEEAPSLDPAERRFPSLLFEVSDDGSLRRRFTETRCSDIGHVWMEMLKNASIRKELEAIADQEKNLLAAARLAKGDLPGYRAQVENILLPHQLDQIRQLTGRYRCLTTGVMQQLEAGDAFSSNPVTREELQRVRDSLAEITKRCLATSERELKTLNLEVRKTLTRAQLLEIQSLIGDRKLLEGPFLDFAILRLETIADRRQDKLDVGLSESAAVLGRSTKYRLTLAGHLQPMKNDTPMDFYSAFRNGIYRAGLKLDTDQQELLADFENNLVTEVSSRSKRVYQLLTEEKITLDEAKNTLTSVATREINRTVSLFDAMLTRGQQDRVDEYVLRRDLVQRGMLAVLVEGRRIPVSDDQKKTLLALIEHKLTDFRKLTRETEEEIWGAVRFGLGPPHRQLWTEAYGDGTLKSLPVSPVLLLFQ